jgi:hypothetical protein
VVTIFLECIRTLKGFLPWFWNALYSCWWSWQNSWDNLFITKSWFNVEIVLRRYIILPMPWFQAISTYLPNFHLVHPIVFGNVTQTHDANVRWGIIVYTTTLVIESWWNWWVVMVACHCYHLWWTWWWFQISWTTFIRWRLQSLLCVHSNCCCKYFFTIS